jgi:hypothetical protein
MMAGCCRLTWCLQQEVKAARTQWHSQTRKAFLHHHASCELVNRNRYKTTKYTKLPNSKQVLFSATIAVIDSSSQIMTGGRSVTQRHD